MLISGLILTIDDSEAAFAVVEASLRTKPEITIGERDGIYLPVATEAEGPRHAESIQGWLGTLPGMRQVDVVSVQFADDEPECTPARSRRREEADEKCEIENGPPPYVGGYASATTPQEILP